MKKIKRLFVFTICVMCFATQINAQGLKMPQPSSTQTLIQDFGLGKITLTYSRPSVRGRVIFGGLEPYGKVWRAGANKATILEVDRDVTVEGKKLPAGKYSLFLTPNENEWTVILNSETGQWGVKQGGVANRDPAKDVLSVNVKPVKSASLTERLTYDVTGDGIVMRWENVELPVAIK